MTIDSIKSLCFRNWNRANEFATVLNRHTAMGTIELTSDSKGRPTVLTDANEDEIDAALDEIAGIVEADYETKEDAQ